MSWPEAVVICAVTLVFLGALAAIFLLLHRAVRQAAGESAGEWQLRCTRCGRTRGATEAGLVRLGAFAVSKYTLGYCAGCGERLRVIALERKPTASADRAATAAGVSSGG